MISAYSNILPSPDSGSPLPYNYSASTHSLAAISFYTEPLRIAVSTITTATATFFMSHLPPPLWFFVSLQEP